MSNDVNKKFHHYVLRQPFHTEDIINQTYTIEMEICAKVVDLAEAACVEAAIEAAMDAGVTDLYLMDRRFVIDALVEKMQREREKHD